MLIMSIAMAIDFAVIIAVLQRNILRKKFYNINFDIFPGDNLDALIKALILFILPIVLVNYLFIFRNNRYEKLLFKYNSHNGKLFFVYFYITLLIPFSLAIYVVFFRDL